MRTPEPASATSPPEIATVAGAFTVYGAIFFDRLAPLYLVHLIASDLGVPDAAEGTLALLIGLGWAGAMLLARAASGRWADRTRILVGAGTCAVLSLASAAAPGWLAFIALRGLGGLAAGTASPAVTALSFAAAPPRRRGLDLGLVQSSTRVLGSLASPVAVTAVAVAWGWRPAIMVSAAFLAVGALVLASLVPAGASTRAARRRDADLVYIPGGVRDVAVCTAVSVVLIAWLMIFSQSGVPLVSGWLDVPADVAGRYVGLFGIGSAIAAMAVPIGSDTVGRKAALVWSALIGGGSGVAAAMLAALGVVPPLPVVALLLLLAGVTMGGLPLSISIVPAEAVASGDVGRALAWPIAVGEIAGGAALPALAAAAAVPLGLGPVVAAGAAAVGGTAGLALLLRPR